MDAPPLPEAAFPTVLVVDDDEPVRAVITALLSDEGYGVRSAHDGLEALAILGAAPIDAVVSDVKMPRLDGFGLVRRMRERGYATPVVLMSAVHHSGDAPGVPFVPKPFDADVLVAELARILGEDATPQEASLAGGRRIRDG